jgi:hypothetical protein
MVTGITPVMVTFLAKEIRGELNFVRQVSGGQNHPDRLPTQNELWALESSRGNREDVRSRNGLPINPKAGIKGVYLPLGTPNKAAAAARARDIYFSLIAVGWEPTLARFKKPKAAASAASNEQQCTVGEFLDAVAEAATNRSTVEGYAKKFRQIVYNSSETASGITTKSKSLFSSVT